MPAALSALKDERVRACQVLKGRPSPRRAVKIGDKKAFIEAVRHALVCLQDLQLCPRLCAVASRAAKEHDWPLELRRLRDAVARRLHHSGASSSTASKKRSTPTRSSKTCCCIPFFTEATATAQDAWRQCRHGRRTDGLPGARVQHRPGLLRQLPPRALASQFVASPARLLRRHTYQRVDKPRDQKFHSEWLDLRKQPK